MNPEGDEFVALGNIHARRANLIDELRRHAVNAEGNQLVCIQPLEVSRFDFTRELQADVVNGHGPLLFCVDSVEAQRLHFLYVLGIGEEMENSRALAVLHESFAFKSAGVPRNRKMRVLTAGFRQVQAGELFHFPVGARVKVMPAA